MNKPDTAAVKTEEVWKIFEQEAEEVQAVRGVTLTIEPGEFVAMAGPSGSGKTTLLNLIGGLTRPTRGGVWIADRDLTRMSNRELARLRLEKVGFIFQAYNLLPVLTALENAEFPLLLQGVNGGERRRRVMHLFERTGLAGLEDRRPGKLSGGQQQRVAVIRAVVAEPALVLADEPTANLDSAGSDRLLDMMEELNRHLGTTFLFATHDPRVMERARRLIRLVDGAVDSDERREPEPER
ncbi:MAG: macrolide ABC transporter ATP-binding protein [Gemmatimonas sp. SM23_52]|nr:MAG: macrolide ABC transporter ATP-binding protein [Gemmatimonas sp. SM23_52]